MTEALTGIRAVARVLIQNDRGDLLLCRSADGNSWVPPGGTVDKGETFALAAVREAFEEAGLPVELGHLVYVQEFEPAGQNERVVTVAFRARALSTEPDAGRAESAGSAGAPWAAWVIQDLDGPRRLVRWFTKAELLIEPDPVYPSFLREGFWAGGADPYLGLVQAK